MPNIDRIMSTKLALLLVIPQNVCTDGSSKFKRQYLKIRLMSHKSHLYEHAVTANT